MRRVLALIAVLSAVALIGHAQGPVSQLTVHGRVLAAQTGAPLRNVRVQTTAATPPLPPVFTDADGQFSMPRPTADSSGLSAAKAGFVTATVQLRPSNADLELRLSKAGAISGRIIDGLGDPLIGMTVTAQSVRGADAERHVIATDQTDDRGEYRISGLSDGRFIVSVNDVSDILGPDGTPFSGNGAFVIRQGAVMVSSDDLRKQVRVYFPGVQSITDALPISLAAGEERPGVDFSAPANPPVDLLGALGPTAAPREFGVLSTGTAIIRGRVMTSDGRPVPQAVVRLESQDSPRLMPAAVTNRAGEYEFQRLFAAAYSVVASKPGFLTTAYGQQRPSDMRESIELRSSEARNDVNIALRRPSALSGRITDESGEPMERASVHVLRIQYRDGRRRLVDAGGGGTHRTDDRGAYRIYGLPPGEYFVSGSAGQVTAGQPSSDRPGYATTYLPGTVNPAEARRITIDGVQDVTDLDFALSRTPTARIAGTIVDATGNPVIGGLLLATSRRSAAVGTEAADARIDRDGRFEFPNVSPGEYVIHASKGRKDPYTEGEGAVHFVTVNGSDVTNLRLRLSRGSTLRGRITLEGTPSPELYTAVTLQALPVDPDRTPQNVGSPASARIQSDWTFAMEGLSGPRVLRLTDAPRGWMLAAVRLNGQDVTDSPLPFGTSDQSTTDVEVVLTDRVSKVVGRVTDARGQAVPGAIAVLFSTDRTRWGDTSRFVTVSRAADRDGMFSVEQLPSGEYYVAAVTSLEAGEWHDPELLEALIPEATHLTISQGETASITLRALSR